MTMSRTQPYSSRHAAPTPLARWAVVVGEFGMGPRSQATFQLLRHRPLWAALAVLTVLSLRLDNSVRTDEALGLFVGSWIRRAWATGEDVYSRPDTFYGGVPSLYPPLASLVESIGGLLGVRLMSLLLMAFATIAVFVLTDALFDTGQGWRPGSLAALLFASSGPVLVQAHLALPDTVGIALLLCALALGVRAARCSADNRWRALSAALGAGGLVGLSIIVSYPTLLAVPFALAALFAYARAAGPPDIIQHYRLALLLGAIQAPVLALVVVGPQWLTGAWVTLTQVSTGAGFGSVLLHTVGWTIVPLGLALLASRVVSGPALAVVRPLAVGVAVLAGRQALAGGDLTAYLGLAVALAVPGAGMLLAKLAKVRYGWAALVAVGYAALTTGMAQSQDVFGSWPDSTPLVRQVSYAVDAMPWIRMVGESPEAVQYGMWGRLEPWQVQATYPGSFRYNGLSDLDALRAALADNYVQLVFFDGSTEAGRLIDPTAYGFRLTDTVAQSGTTNGAWRIYQRFDAVPAR